VSSGLSFSDQGREIWKGKAKCEQLRELATETVVTVPLRVVSARQCMAAARMSDAT